MVQLDILILTGSLADANNHVGSLKDPFRSDLGYLPLLNQHILTVIPVV